MKNLLPSRFKTIIFLLLCLVCAAVTNAQSGQWAWLRGSNTINQLGHYGTQGTPATGNVPGATTAAVSWNCNGLMYMMGGDGYDKQGGFGYLGDLFVYDTAANKWTWLKGPGLIDQPGVYGTKGTPAAGNRPGTRTDAITWVLNNKLYLMGGQTTDAPTLLNDLWVYDPATNNWTWIGGSNIINQPGVYGTMGTPGINNVPGSREDCATWVYNNKLYLFGGYGVDGSSVLDKLNDVWMFDPATSEWTWLGGSQSVNQFTQQATAGTMDAGNMPGARSGTVSWVLDNKLYMAEGYGEDIAGTNDYLNDMWQYDPSINQWAWLSGSLNAGQTGTYGTQGVPDAGNAPGGRSAAMGWANNNKLYLFGGSGLDATGGGAALNDLWSFDLTSRQWTWLSGGNTVGQPGIYGTRGTADAANTPGSRYSAVSWLNNGKLYLQGGTGFDGGGNFGIFNDLWVYANPAPPAAPTITSFTPTTATGGVKVTISGTDFTGTSAVSFGGTAAASFTVNSNTQIVAVVALGATGDVSVTTPLGTGTLPGFTFVPNPVPVITSFTPASAFGNAAVSISGTGFTGTSAVSFGGTAATSFTVNSDISITALVATSGASGDVSVTTPGGTATLAGFTFTGPGYCDAGSNDPNYEKVGNVTLGGINNTTTAVVPYEDFTNLSTKLAPGSSNNMQVTISSSYSSDKVAVYIDFNRDGDFDDDGETLYTSPEGYGPDNFTIAIPAGTALGTTRMRVRLWDDNVNVDYNSPCGTTGYGQVEDYTLDIENASEGAPVITSFTPSSGLNESTVVITGTGFTNAASVFFGGIAASSFTVDSDTQISAVVAGGATGNITVGSPDGTATSADVFTYTFPVPVITSFSPTEATATTTVVITGSYLDGATVTLGGTPATVTLNNSTEIDVVVGAGATGDVVVTTLGGTATQPGFTFIFTPAPTITSFTPASGSIGTTVTITGTNFDNTTAVSFGGVAASSFTINSSTEIAAVTAGGSGAVSVTTPGGTATMDGFTTPYCDASGTPDQGTITNVTAGTINHNNTATDGYQDLTSVSANLNAGFTYPAVVTISNGATQDVAAIYIDFNHDGDFDEAGERFTIDNDGINGNIYTSYLTINVPADAVLGATRMRVRAYSPYETGDPSACGTLAGGQVQDYTVVLNATPVPAITSFTPTSAASSKFVTITGTNFDQASDVRFGGTPAGLFTVNSSTQITALVDGGTTGTISVTTPGGTATKDGFTYIAGGYCAAGGNGPEDEKISRVTIGSITNSTTSTVPYEDFTNLSTILAPGSNNSMQVRLSNGFNSDEVAVYIDFNHDGDFDDAGETVYTSAMSAGPFSFTLPIPAGAALGNTTMRVRLWDDGADPDYNSPCGFTQYGQVEDYTVDIDQPPLPTITSFTPTSATVGQTVVITGTNFTGATSVKFSTKSATSFVVNSATQISAVLSTGSSGSVSVTTPYGTATLAGFTYLTPAAPTITSFTPTSATSGQTVVITGTGFTGASSVKFGGRSATSYIVNSATQISAIVSTGTTGSVTVATANGTATLAGFTYIAPPVPTITSFTPTSAVLGQTVVITGTNLNGATAVKFGGTSAASFTVNSATQITAVVATGNTGSVSVTAPGGTATLAGFTYLGYCTAGTTHTNNETIGNVALGTINNSSSSTGSYEDFTSVSTNLAAGSDNNMQVTLNASYASDVVAVYIDLNNDLDFDDAGETVYTSSQGFGPFSFTLTLPANTTLGTKRMRIRVYDAGYNTGVTACGNTQYGQVEDYTINVTAPQASVSGTATVCLNAPTPAVTFRNFSGATPYTFTYTLNGGAQQTVTTAGTDSSAKVTIPAGTLGTFTYTFVSVTDNNGNTQAATGTATVTVNATSTSTTPVAICSAALPYVWNGNSYYTTGNYTFTTTNATGCDSVATLALTVTGTSTTLVTVNKADLPYHWNGNDYNVAGVYNYTTTGAAGCDSVATLRLAVNMLPPPASFRYNTPNVFVKDTTIAPLSPAIDTPGTIKRVGPAFVLPAGVASDAAGNIYVVDNGAGNIIKIAPDGTFKILAGGFASPYSIAVDAAQNVYVVDQGNFGNDIPRSVSKISADGNTITPFGHDFNIPFAVAADLSGNVFVSDGVEIMKVAPDGTTITNFGENLNGVISLATDAAGNVYVGDYGGTISKIPADGSTVIPVGFMPNEGQPAGIAIDASGNVYGTDLFNSIVYKFAINGTTTTIGSGFISPVGITSDAAGNVYLADSYNYALKEILAGGTAVTGYTISPALPSGLAISASTGVISGTPLTSAAQAAYTVTASGASGSATANLVIAINNKAGDLFGYNTPNIFLKDHFISTLKPVFTVPPIPADSIITLASNLYLPNGVAVDSKGNVYVADSYNNQVKKISADGSTTTVIGSGFYLPLGLTVDASGNVYVADGGNHAVKMIAPDGVTVTTVPATFSQPFDVALDASGNLYVADASSTRIKKVTPGGASSNVGSGFYNPTGVAVDAAGNVYVADFGNGVIKKVTVGGAISTVGGAAFSGPAGVKVDALGNIYVADDLLSSITKMTSDGSITTTYSSGFFQPVGLALDTAGNIYVADQGNNAIKKIAGAAQVVTQYAVSPPLPDGLVIDQTSGIISGTPLAVSPRATYTVTGTRAVSNLTAAVSIRVIAADTAVVAVCTSALPYHWNGNDYSTPGLYTAHLAGVRVLDSVAYLALTVNASPTAAAIRANQQVTTACYGLTRKLIARPTGGTAPYLYSIDGTTWQDSARFEEPAGTYHIIVKDNNGCTVTTGDITLTQPVEKLAITGTQVTGADITVTATGGYGGYTYSLDGGAYSTSNTLTGVSAGIDTVRVHDQGGCIAAARVNILTATVTYDGGNNMVCYNRNKVITITPAGGVRPYRYTFDGNTAGRIMLAAPGTHTITVQDAAGNSYSTGITITAPAEKLNLTLAHTNATCAGGDGSITALPSGGYAGYTYSLNSGSYAGENVFNNLDAGTYSVSAMDAAGCTSPVRTAIVKVPVNPCPGLRSGDEPTSSKGEMAGALVVKVMPNPAVVEFTLQVVSGDSKKVVEIRVMDMLGRTVYHTRGSVFDSYRFGRNFAGGMYIAEVLNGTSVQRVKLVKGN